MNKKRGAKQYFNPIWNSKETLERVSELWWYLLVWPNRRVDTLTNFAQDTYILKSNRLTFLEIAKLYTRTWLEWRDSQQAWILITLSGTPAKTPVSCLCLTMKVTLHNGRLILTPKWASHWLHHCHLLQPVLCVPWKPLASAWAWPNPLRRRRAILQPCVEWLQASRIYFQVIWRSKQIMFPLEAWLRKAGLAGLSQSE